MWSYSFELPILMILGIILLFYFSRPRLLIRKNRVFLMMIMIETMTIIIDVSATAADIHYTLFPALFVSILNMLYFIAFFFRAYIMYLFAVSVMKDTLEKKAVIRFLIRLPLYLGIILSVASMLMGSAQMPYCIFYIDESGYHAGKMYNYLYVCGYYYVLMSFVSSYLFRNRLGRRREKLSMLLYNLILFTSLAVRLTMPEYLIMDTFIFMAILVVFLAFENPEYFLDLKGVTFNSLAMGEHLEENLGDMRIAPMGVVIHNFHEMRDVYGTSPMEEGLTMIGRYLKQIFPMGKVFYCRNGRFVVIDRVETDFGEKSRVINERFRQPWKSKTIELYLSVGFATFCDVSANHSAEIILSTIKKALEIVGRAGESEPICFTDDDLKRTEKEVMVRQSIKAAIDNGGFELYLQPIVDASSGRTIGAEALSRIKDPEGNIIEPDEFIPVAENSGSINELGELVFDRTCRFIKEEGLEKMGIEWINVNLSPAQFVRTNLAERYSAIVEKYGIDPSKVHLEITEGSTIDDSFLQRQIGAMGEKGFKFVLDDYGTGFSNLARIKKCPFINIKLDMSIVWDYCKEPDAILPNMIRAFKHMGFMITAEGIENGDMVSTMTNIGCDFLQGYHYSRPVPAKEFARKYST